MLGTKLFKNNADDMSRYTECAIACNEAGNLTIEDKGDYYEVVEIPVYVETAEEIQKRLTDGVQNWMDSKVQERNYDNVHTCVGTYLYSPVEKFRLEAEAVRDWVYISSKKSSALGIDAELW